ncbi:MAG: hypothetical protein KDJ52_19285 [Anaerolineae bacterium]|nr:hypothetical protein [Anaerolineae bacterium]
MSVASVEKNRIRFPKPKFEASWEAVRFGMITVALVVTVVLVYFTLFVFVDWFYPILFGVHTRSSTVIFATFLTLLLYQPLKESVQSVVDYLFFRDTGQLSKNVDMAIRTLGHINDRDSLQNYLEEELANILQVDGVYMHQNAPSVLLRYAVTLPLRMGRRELGFLTIGPKLSGRSYSLSERELLSNLQEQVSLVLSGLQLAEVREEAERVSNMKSEFITNVSHQLRTPLNVVINSTGLVADGILGEITPEQTQYLARAVQGSEYLKKLLNDILDITKLEIGQLTLQIETFDISLVVEDILPMINGMLADKPITFEQDIPEQLPYIVADRTRLRQILLNLLSNAVKFTREGVVTLRIWQKRGWVFFTVIDTGIGIAEKDLSLVFEDFQQVSAKSMEELRIERRRHLGTGLGMPITKALVELHGGRIWVESELGVGSGFHFALPVKVQKN